MPKALGVQFLHLQKLSWVYQGPFLVCPHPVTSLSRFWIDSDINHLGSSHCSQSKTRVPHVASGEENVCLTFQCFTFRERASHGRTEARKLPVKVSWKSNVWALNAHGMMGISLEGQG